MNLKAGFLTEMSKDRGPFVFINITNSTVLIFSAKRENNKRIRKTAMAPVSLHRSRKYLKTKSRFRAKILLGLIRSFKYHRKKGFN